MSFILSKDDTSREQRDIIREKCNITIHEKYMDNVFNEPVFRVENDNIILPLNLWKDLCEEFPTKKKFVKYNLKFKGQFIKNEKKDQKQVFEESIERLKDNHVCLLELMTNYGKTFISISICCHLQYKTLILCHFSSVHDHWVDDFRLHSNVNPQIVKDDDLDPKKNVYVMGVLKAQNMLKKNPKIFDNIGFVIVDEVHAVVEAVVYVLLRIQPKYLVGLSATPDRRDNLHELLIPFFGDFSNNIIRFITKPFEVYKVETGIKPDIEKVYNYMKRRETVNWSVVLRSVSHNNKRQEYVCDLCQKFPDDKIIILTKRVCEYLGCDNHKKCENYQKEDNKLVCEKSIGIYNMLKERGEKVDYISSTKKKYDPEARILIGTGQKIGVGFDDKSFRILMVISDVIDVRQNEGRIRQDNNIILDLVDDYSILENHWKEREEWYIRKGGTIKLWEDTPKNTGYTAGGRVSKKEEYPQQRKRLLPPNTSKE